MKANGHQVPGYTGYIQGARADNITGAGFGALTKLQMRGNYAKANILGDYAEPGERYVTNNQAFAYR